MGQGPGARHRPPGAAGAVWGLTRRRLLSNQPTLARARKSRENERLSAPSLASLQIAREDGPAFQQAEATSPEVGPAQSAKVLNIARLGIGQRPRTSSLSESTTRGV